VTPIRYRYLSEADVERCMPAPRDAVELARRALVARAEGRATQPPKLALAPDDRGFAVSMPASVVDGDLLGLKWVTVFRGNGARGLETINGVVLLCDGATGLPRAVMGASVITGRRTAAVSGACMAALAPADVGHVAITGAGVQTRSHLEVCAGLGLHDVVVFARRAEAAEALREFAAERAPDVRLRCVDTAAAAVEGAGIVVTGVLIGSRDARIAPELVRDDALLLPLDYATSIGADIANGAALWSDDPSQVTTHRDHGDGFEGYRDPDGFTGEALQRPRPTGRVVCQNMGIGAADLVFAEAILARAEAEGIGTLLDR
jgi:ornithine cyclodeaminase/alanine dehydrogenase-like protein (mu-crystallin family)